ncbi:unnamed protein product [Caenorhabditis nigoni]
MNELLLCVHDQIGKLGQCVSWISHVIRVSRMPPGKSPPLVTSSDGTDTASQKDTHSYIQTAHVYTPADDVMSLVLEI